MTPGGGAARLRQYLRGLSVNAELAIVVFVAFGYFMVSELRLLVYPERGHISESHLQWLLIYEPAVSAILIGFLYVRGWTFSRIGLRPGLQATMFGLLLALG